MKQVMLNDIYEGGDFIVYCGKSDPHMSIEAGQIFEVKWTRINVLDDDKYNVEVYAGGFIFDMNEIRLATKREEFLYYTHGINTEI